METRKMLANMVVAEKGKWEVVQESLMKKNYPGDEIVIQDNYITIMDENYPDRLKQVFKPPFVLFYEGNLDLLKNTDIIAIGADSLWDYSWDKISDLLDFTGNHHYIIDGTKPIAIGLAQSLKNFIVMVNCGLDKVSTELAELVHRNGGLIITEFPSGVESCDYNDHTRVMSGLEKKLVVVHCERYGVAIRQIMNSNQLGHNIYVMPTPLDSVKETRNNEIIAEGGTCFYTKEQLAE